ncbi:MAG: tyrosine--tRNA ligase [Patescibacteria group bacterium]
MLDRLFSERVNTDPQKVNEILTRGVEDVFVRENLQKKLLSGKQLRIKFGIDPTGSGIHIGRATILRKLKKFQDLGHKIVFIIGDFTAQIGDPSDKLEKRPMLTKREVKENILTYKQQIAKILNTSQVEFHFNSEWLEGLNFQKISELAEMFSVGQMLERRNFKDRYSKGEEISLREFLYPLIQGYDSVMVKADIEIGGFDQLFNLKAGRVVQKHFGVPEQDVLTLSMLSGTDGRKMSTSWGNVINIMDTPSLMFGKIMSVSDDLIEQYFLLCTDVPTEEISKIGESIKNHTANPKDHKVRLAKEIVSIYHSEKEAKKAEDGFFKVFKDGDIPDDAPQVSVEKGTDLVDILIKQRIVSSKTEWRRLVEEGAIYDIGNSRKITETNEKVPQNLTLRVGKKRFIKISIK